MIKYIIVDDETASHEVIQDYASNLPFLSFQKSCYNAFEAIDHLNNNKTDLIFLDINMPKLSGLEFLKTLSDPPKIIITSAYKEFALEGYELNIDDYLLKPFNFTRFVKAVNKINDKESRASNPHKNVEINDDEKLFIKEDKKYHQVKLSEILFAEAYGNYIKIHLKDKMILSHQSLLSFLQALPDEKFIRVHKSFIVSIDKIELIDGNRILIQGHTIPIGKMYKLNINKLLE